MEELHAYAAGELNPAERAHVEAELEAHPENRARLEKVRAMRGLLASAAPEEPDDLTWKRMQQRIQAELAQPSSPKGSRTGVWLPVGIAAAAVIVTLVLLDRAPIEAPSRREDSTGPQVLASGSAPLDVTLASGTALHLAPSSEVMVKSPEARPTELVLELGQLDVRSPMRLYQGEPAVMVRTPVYVAAAASLDFTVGFRSEIYFVEARDGQIAVEGDGFDEGTIVKAGERRTVKSQLSVHPPKPPSRVKKILKRSAIQAKRAEPIEEKIEEKAAEPEPLPPAPEVKESSEGETSVEVVLEEDDLIRRKWLEAALAYYERRDLDVAIELARQVVKEGPNRAEGRMAEVMLCEALITTKRPSEAIEVCEKRLLRPQTEEEKREIHFLLATIHHRQLKNCEKAIEHYGHAIVFGGTSLLDDRVRLFRASCALETGRLDLASVDLRSLKTRQNRLPNPEELDRLLARLTEARRSVRASGENNRKDGERQ